MSDFHYVGEELDVFRHAVNWKSYVQSKLRNFLVGDVLEVGAGIGASTQVFNDGSQKRWVCLEPDPTLAIRIRPNLPPNLTNCEVRVCGVADLSASEQFDAVLYMDVLEHIEDDKAELSHAAIHLRPGGHLIVLAPAMPWLYTPFDAAIGHYRRYTRKMLRAACPVGFREKTVQYLDSVGILASVGNRLLLRSATPAVSQIKFWDNCLVRASRAIDPLVLHSFGRSISAIWRKPPTHAQAIQL